MNKFIEVYLAAPVPGKFTYEVPKELSLQLSYGKRVLVPFGPRKTTAYIINILHHYENKDFKIKKIISILDSKPVFTKNLQKLFEWMSNYYIYPTGLTIKSSLPSGINPQIIKKVEITPPGKDFLKRPTNKTICEILEKIKEKPLDEKFLLKQNIQHQSILNLQKKGLLQIIEVAPSSKTKEKFEKFLTRIKSQSAIKLTDKQLEVLEKIPFNELTAKKDITSKIKGSSTIINALKKKGLIQESEKRVFRDPLGEIVDKDIPPNLTPEQIKAVNTISEFTGKEFKRYLLHGVTGSGKTEVYLRLVQKALDLGKTAIVLVPEISLISQTERRFKARFGELTAVMHSNLTPGEKLDQWTKTISGEKRVVIGARSAIFAPTSNVGIIIVDEEHDQSYKQDLAPRYNGRDMAVVRSEIENCPVVLGSATPSMETYKNANTNRFEKIVLSKRANNQNLPKVIVYDLKDSSKDKGPYKFISYFLALKINKTLKNNNQVMLFLNRRGFSSFILCNLCGEAIKCSYCSVSMTYHKSTNSLVCHICGYKTPLPNTCPDCGNPDIVDLGVGTEKLESACNFLFPNSNTIRLDQDTTAKKGELVKKLKLIRDKKADIIIGTQMIAKGHDFPGITLVGIINADHGFNLPDFRAAERSFQLLSQVAGRAGRGEKEGLVVLQTYSPDHFSIKTAKTQNFTDFYKHEIEFRKSLFYPPFSKTALIKISGTDKIKADNLSKNCAKVLKDIKLSFASLATTQILGPAESPLFIAASRYRYQILLKSDKSSKLNFMIKEMKKKFASLSKDLRISIDIDPYSMM